MDFFTKMMACDFKNLLRYLFKKCKFVRNTAALMLDSDKLGDLAVKKSCKLRVLQSLFLFLEKAVTESNNEEGVGEILEYIYRQPGVMQNFIFNLSSPDMDDETVIIGQVTLIGAMCLHKKKFVRSE